ncbi:hypothetical protein BGW38_002982 [Lunasporangiospora selenospora]|uniref:Uncharacterized protein n=1 Tax=Lunasporangiospora selenospora TaxID=979761 RepID=A0A9P6KD04_9FUNG|nr:hypothetical protein BGW38_002982 [Lunasporangiospora selenospora]
MNDPRRVTLKKRRREKDESLMSDLKDLKRNFWSTPGVGEFIDWISNYDNYRKLDVVRPTHGHKRKDVYIQIADYVNKNSDKPVLKKQKKARKQTYEVEALPGAVLNAISKVRQGYASLDVKTSLTEIYLDVKEKQLRELFEEDKVKIVSQLEKEREHLSNTLDRERVEYANRIKTIQEVASIEKAELKAEIQSITTNFKAELQSLAAAKEQAVAKMWESRCEIAVLKERLNRIKSGPLLCRME